MNKPFSLTSKLSIWVPPQWVLIAGVALSCALPSVADSLWKDDVARPMLADKRAVAVGDIVTIIIAQTTTAAKDNTTTTAKKSSQDASISSFFFSPGASKLLTKNGSLPALKYSSENGFSGGGTIKNSETITTSIGVRVIDVLPNGNLVIEGTRETAFSGERQTAVLRGVVRSADVSANNTVYSYNVADVSIKFTSSGSITDSQKKGWFNKVWDKVSPF